MCKIAVDVSWIVECIVQKALVPWWTKVHVAKMVSGESRKSHELRLIRETEESHYMYHPSIIAARCALMVFDQA